MTETKTAKCEECDVVLTPANDPREFLVTPGGQYERVCINCHAALKWDFSRD